MTLLQQPGEIRQFVAVLRPEINEILCYDSLTKQPIEGCLKVGLLPTLQVAGRGQREPARRVSAGNGDRNSGGGNRFGVQSTMASVWGRRSERPFFL
jgi:hypothetical protein